MAYVEFEGKLMKVTSGVENDSLTIKASNQSATITLPPDSVATFQKGTSIKVTIESSGTLYDDDPHVGKPSEGD